MFQLYLDKIKSVQENIKYKVAAALVILVVFCGMAYTIKSQNDLIKAMQQTTADNKMLTDSIAELRSQMLTKENFNKELGSFSTKIDEINKEVARLNGNIYSAIGVTSLTPGAQGTDVPSTGWIPNPYPTKPSGNPGGSTAGVNPQPKPEEPKDTYGYLTKIPYLTLTEPIDNQQAPVATVLFNARNQNPWTYQVYPRKYNTNIILATDGDDKKVTFVESTVEVKGKTYKLTNTQARYIEKYPNSQFRLWNPRVMLGVGAGISTEPGLSLTTTAELFVASYGKTKSKSDWYIAGVGAGVNIPNSRVVLSITPFAYNVTKNQMFSNINIGPNVAFDVKGNTYVGVGLRLSL